eukprot:Em0011g511a
MYSRRSLCGRTLFITGASRGIGKAIALRAARDGANIVIAAKTTEPHPKLPGTIYTAAKEIEEAGGKCLPCVVDIRDEVQIQQAADKAVSTFGGIDILVNNASAIFLARTTDTPMKRFDLMMGVNARGTFATSKICIPYLKKGKNPHILNISPPLNMKPVWFASHCAYTIAKYGMSMCVLGMAEELKPDGIAVNALWPRTAIATAAMEMLGGEESIRASRKPEIMADAAYCILTSDKSLTGQFLIDDAVLKQHGISNLDQYANVPGEPLLPDFFLDEAEHIQGAFTAHNKQQSSPPTASISSDSPEHIFKKVQPLLNTELVKQIGATYLFVIHGKYKESWLLDLKNGTGTVGPTAGKSVDADVTLRMDSDDLTAMFSGKLTATTAFMAGKLKIVGSMGHALALEKLMKKFKSRL